MPKVRTPSNALISTFATMTKTTNCSEIYHRVRSEVARRCMLSLLLCASCSLQGKPFDLETPVMTEAPPGPGLRVRQVALEYSGTEVYHALYLPEDWKPGGKYPLIVEYTGNRFPVGG